MSFARGTAGCAVASALFSLAWLGCVGDDPTPSAPIAAPSDAATAADTSTPPSSADAGDGGTAEDAASGFCSTASGTIVVCDDFDTDPLTKGWVVTKSAGATVQLTASDKSKPYAFQSSVPASTGDAPANAFVERSLPVPTDFKALQVAFDVRIADRDNVAALKEVARVTFGSEGLVLSSGANELTLDQLESGNPKGGAAAVTAPSGVWIHIELRLVRNDSSLSVTGLHDGDPLSTDSLTLPAPGPTQFWALILGAANTSSNGACRFVYENVLVTSE